MTTAVEWIHDLLDAVGSAPARTPDQGGSGLRRGGGGGRRGASGLRQCPAHPDPHPSLSIGVGDAGQVLLHCFAGCAVQDVLRALRIGFATLRSPPPYPATDHVRAWRVRVSFPPPEPGSGASPAGRGLRLEAVHDYGGWVLERWRHPVTGAKDLRWFTRRAGSLIPGLLGRPLRDLPLYREREVRMAVVAAEPVHVVESESSVDAFTRHGLYATTWAGGAAAPDVGRLAQVLAGADVVLVPDHDTPGLACGRLVWEALAPVAGRLRAVLPAPGEDARDLLAADGVRAFAA